MSVLLSLWSFGFHRISYCKRYSNYEKTGDEHCVEDTGRKYGLFVVFLSNPTFLTIPPSFSTSTHAGPLLCTRGYFYDYFSMCIVFLYILLIRINKTISMTSMAVALFSD